MTEKLTLKKQKKKENAAKYDSFINKLGQKIPLFSEITEIWNLFL